MNSDLFVEHFLEYYGKSQDGNKSFVSFIGNLEEDFVRPLLDLFFPIRIDHYSQNIVRERFWQVDSFLEEQLRRFKIEEDRLIRIKESFFKGLTHLINVFEKDLDAFLKNDPATQSVNEIIVCYPGFYAIMVYRVANLLFKEGVPMLPRMMTELAHSKTGIDIHPGASIGESFFIDHGTGIVIGETSIIGKNVSLYQGVTLGALAFKKDSSGTVIKDQKRHPHICDHVTIYAGATILGSVTVGEGAIIGGNVWIRESIPSQTQVMISKPQLNFKKKT